MFDKEVIQQLTGDVCVSMLGLDLSIHDHPVKSHGETRYYAHIGIEGAWQCEVCLICPNALARHFAAAMFMSEPDDVTEGEIGDSVGELVNILGGNIKGVLPGENSLTLPSVVKLDESQIAELKSQETDVHFSCDGLPFTIRYREPVECEPCPE